MTDLTPIAGRVASLVRMLSSDRECEVINAVRALLRTLKSAGADIHVLADRVEKPNGSALTNAEMKKLYDAGYQDGVREAENKMHGNSDFRDIDGFPAWSEIALYCQRNNRRLRANEQGFVNDMASQTVWREPTEKQAKWLKSIFLRLGGRL
jgi:DNA-binding FrmR family transcriptional regulator